MSYLTALGDDTFGRKIRAFLTANHISDELAFCDPKRMTGFMLKGKTSRGDPPIQYFRKGSAASALGVEETSRCLEGRAGGFLHMTGIFPALDVYKRQTIDCFYISADSFDSVFLHTYYDDTMDAVPLDEADRADLLQALQTDYLAGADSDTVWDDSSVILDLLNVARCV